MSKLKLASLVGILAGAGLLGGGRPAEAADQLLFCNRPERLTAPGAYADARLEKGRVYRIFFHYYNASGRAGPLVVEFQGAAGKPLTILAQKGIADPHKLPPIAGRQAAARFLSRGESRYTHQERVRFPMTLAARQTGSGVIRVRVPDQNVRLRIHFRGSRAVVAGARVTAVDTPRKEYEVALTATSNRQFFRIGVPDSKLRKALDGTYGFLYQFKLTAPEGRKVRIAFSPRGGQSGMVGLVGGLLRQTPIIPAAAWSVFSTAVVGKDGLVVTTLPFGGVFYPVEVEFRLI